MSEQFYYVMRYKNNRQIGWDVHNTEEPNLIHRYGKNYSFVPGGTLEENAAECCRQYEVGELVW